jgi:hypothetical protein
MGFCDARRDQKFLHPTVVSQEVLIVEGGVHRTSLHKYPKRVTYGLYFP